MKWLDCITYYTDNYSFVVKTEQFEIKAFYNLPCIYALGYKRSFLACRLIIFWTIWRLDFQNKCLPTAIEMILIEQKEQRGST